jgi:hypothetical protein
MLDSTKFPSRGFREMEANLSLVAARSDTRLSSEQYGATPFSAIDPVKATIIAIETTAALKAHHD